MQKMKLRCALALIVMLALAVGRIREKRGMNLRSLVKVA
ncbi:IS4-like transposase [Calderihabitans maritimus]|uniref:IS4-like transposase n=1 Tax=Calderihabitans maritimus TaxID=1246530 RepID=A0A1Z5HUC8_9FIRM|nr:IS4-like transposase [Calderihabitans maritimus]